MNTSSLLIGWVTDSRKTVDLGAVSGDTYVMRAHCHVIEAFNSDGTDTLTVGTDVDPDAFITSIDVSTTGIKTATLGVRAGFTAAASPIKAFYANSGSAPTTGKAVILLELAKTPPLPT